MTGTRGRVGEGAPRAGNVDDILAACEGRMTDAPEGGSMPRRLRQLLYPAYATIVHLLLSLTPPVYHTS